MNNNLKFLILNKYGVGLSFCNLILNKYGLIFNKNYGVINNKILFKNLEKNLLFFFQKKERIIRIRHENVKKKIDNGSFYGYKKIRNLPMYGQRTKTNNRTGRRKIV